MKRVIVSLGILVLLALAAGTYVLRPDPLPPETQRFLDSIPGPRTTRFTMRDFENIRLGMSLDKVDVVLDGQGALVSSNESSLGRVELRQWGNGPARRTSPQAP